MQFPFSGVVISPFARLGFCLSFDGSDGVVLSRTVIAISTCTAMQGQHRDAR